MPLETWRTAFENKGFSSFHCKDLVNKFPDNKEDIFKEMMSNFNLYDGNNDYRLKGLVKAFSDKKEQGWAFYPTKTIYQNS